MSTSASIQVHFDVADVGHRYRRGSFATLDVSGPNVDLNIHFYDGDTAKIDKVIAELVALKQEMDAPVITDSERTCPNRNNGWSCHVRGEHDVCEDDNGDQWPASGAQDAAEMAVTR